MRKVAKTLAAAMVTLASAGMLLAAASGAPKAPAAKSGAPASATAPATTAAPGAAPASTPATLDELHERLMAEAGKGKLTDRVIFCYKEFATAYAHEKIVPAMATEEFWTWLSANKEIRDALVVYLFPKYDAGVVKCLDTLRTKYPAEVTAFPHLAFAMALVYGKAAGSESMREAILPEWMHKNPVPTMEESFAWYVKHEKAMRMPLRTTPWPLLLYVADNDLPLDQRDWALARCANLPPQGFAKVYYEPPYDDSRRKDYGKGKLSGKPYTLENILMLGGICCDRAYYASRIFKSLGVPSLYDRGEGDRGGHAWVAYVGREGNLPADLLFSGRFDYDKYYTGIVFNPVWRHGMLDRDVQLDVAAMMRSYPAYMDALAACTAYQLFKPEERAKVVDLLEGGMQRNAFCDFPWRVMAKGVADEQIPVKVGEKMYEGMLKTFAAQPDLTFSVLTLILTPRLKPATKPADLEVTRNLQVLEKVFLVYEAAKRPDLSVRLRALQGQYLEGVGRRDDALKLLVLSSERYATEHFGFVTLFDRAVKMMQEDKKQDLLLKYMEAVAQKVPQYQSASNAKFNETNPVFTHVIKAYVEVLRAAGKNADALKWEVRLPKKET
jgi:hypothetical protein